MKSVYIRSHSGSYSVRMRENTDQNNSEYGHVLRSESFTVENNRNVDPGRILILDVTIKDTDYVLISINNADTETEQIKITCTFFPIVYIFKKINK